LALPLYQGLQRLIIKLRLWLSIKVSKFWTRGLHGFASLSRSPKANNQAKALAFYQGLQISLSRFPKANNQDKTLALYQSLQILDSRSPNSGLKQDQEPFGNWGFNNHRPKANNQAKALALYQSLSLQILD
jgi:hypothetical protein